MNDQIKRYCKPPGFYIKEELEARGWSQTDLAYIIDMKPTQLNNILTGKNGLTTKTAILLSDAFEMPAEFFTNLQNQFELSNAQPADPSIQNRAKWQSQFPLREMISRKWIEELDSSLLDTQMLRFFEARKINEIPFMGGTAVSHSAKKTSYSSCTPEQIAWLYRVRQIAQTIEAPLYNKEKLLIAIEELKALRSDPDDAPNAFEILRKTGVRLIIVEHLQKSKIDGVCTWIEDQPIVALSNRFDRLDNFWFVLRHELEHVIQEDGLKNSEIIIDNEDTLSIDNSDKIELHANKVAADFCIPNEKIKSFIERKGKFVSEKDILAFSRRLAVHPSLTVGQYQYMTKRWNVFRKYLNNKVCGVREILLSNLKDENYIDGFDHKANAKL